MPSKPHILFVAHDPGGTNVIKPVIEHYAAESRVLTHLLLLGPAAERITSESATVLRHSVRTIATPDFPNELSAEPDDIAAILDGIKPHVVFTATSFNSNLERLAVRFASERSIPTLSILDFWSNYRQRFTMNGIISAPQTLFVADSRMKSGAEAELPQTNVIISGNPHLAGISAKYTEARRIESSILPSSRKARIRFFCENIRHYYPHKPINEFTAVPHFLKSLTECGFQGEVIVRPHPMESREPWEKEVQRWQASKSTIPFSLDTATFDEVLRDDCLAVGFSSMALLETASVGIPTFSFQIGVPDDYFWLPFEDYGIMRLREENDIQHLLTKSAPDSKPAALDTSKHALQNVLQNVLSIIDSTIHPLLFR